MNEILFLSLLVTPFVWITILALIFFLKIKISEKLLSESVKYYSLFMVAVGFLLFARTWLKSPQISIYDYKDWIQVGDYSFKLQFVVDLLGSTYALLSASLIGIIFKFSRNYLHKEQGYFRFIFLLSTLLFGLVIVSFSRSLDILFGGWELVGTTSVLLIGYFYNQNQPARHAVKAIISYRLCDMGILAAYSWAHHYLHTTDFFKLPLVLSHAHGEWALVGVGLFIIWASLAKSGQLPMSSWLPLAMEGPTPSSAIFYGALSVHLGAFLLIRMYAYLSHFPILLIIVGLVGATSALYASFVARTRSDAKTMLAYSTISQVGLIYVEISLGFLNFALFHMVTHASLRTFQFLRSSSVIQDFYENPVVQQNKPVEKRYFIESLVSNKMKKKIYIHALHGFHLDYLNLKIINGLLFPVKMFLNFEKKWMDIDRKILKWILGKF